MKAGFLLQMFSACHKPLRSLFHGQKACRDGGGGMINENFFVEITFLDVSNDFKIFLKKIKKIKIPWFPLQTRRVAREGLLTSALHAGLHAACYSFVLTTKQNREA